MILRSRSLTTSPTRQRCHHYHRHWICCGHCHQHHDCRHHHHPNDRHHHRDQDFISSLLTRRPHLRLTAVASLLHDWLQVDDDHNDHDDHGHDNSATIYHCCSQLATWLAAVFFYWNALMIMVIIVVTVISMRFIMPRFSGGGGNHRDAVDGKTSPLGDQEALAEV